MTHSQTANQPDDSQASLSQAVDAESSSTAASASERASMRSVETDLMASIFLFIALGVLALFLFSQTGRFFSYDSRAGRLFYYAELFSNFRLQIAVLMIPFALIVFRMARWRWLAYGLTAAIAWSLVALAWVYMPAAQPAAGKQKLKIMSFNVLGHNSNKDEVLGLMHEADPDVIMVLEYTEHWHRRLRSLKAKYPHQLLQPRWHGFGLGVFSKYPLSDSKVVQLTRKLVDNPSLITHVNFGGTTIRLCGLHVLSPTNSYRLDLRNEQFGEVANELIGDEVPTVVMGDFNSVTWSPFVQDFMSKTGYRDSRKGFGYQASWPADFVFLGIPIDHALVSEDICVHSRSVGGTAGSDHVPIIFEVSTAR